MKPLSWYIANSPIKSLCLPKRLSFIVVQKTGHNYTLGSQSSLQRGMFIAPVSVLQCQHCIKAHPSSYTELVTVAKKENNSLDTERASYLQSEYV